MAEVYSDYISVFVSKFVCAFQKAALNWSLTSTGMSIWRRMGYWRFHITPSNMYVLFHCIRAHLQIWYLYLGPRAFCGHGPIYCISTYTPFPPSQVDRSLQTGLAPGMSLEVCVRSEPDQPYWVATIITTCGQLLLLRYEGYHDDRRADFWSDIMTSDLHPLGWGRQQGRPMRPPDGEEGVIWG